MRVFLVLKVEGEWQSGSPVLLEGVFYEEEEAMGVAERIGGFVVQTLGV